MYFGFVYESDGSNIVVLHCVDLHSMKLVRKGAKNSIGLLCLLSLSFLNRSTDISTATTILPLNLFVLRMHNAYKSLRHTDEFIFAFDFTAAFILCKQSAHGIVYIETR